MNPLHEAHQAAPQRPAEPVVPMPRRDWRNMTRTIAHYERIEQIGEGTYGQVYRARCKDTNQIVAMKKIRVHHGGYWGLPPTILREIKILKRLRHPNLVQMVEVVSSKGVEEMDEDDEVEEKHKVSKNDKVVDAREGYKGNIFLVLEYVSHDLTGLMDVAYRFNEVQVKSIFKQLLEALQYMHDNKYVHRDIKSSNILIDHHFRLKLADFGLARCIEPPILDRIHDRGNSQEFTNKVITLWYRPPELLLGATRYGTAVDIWSAGCILAELILGKPIFTGKAEMEQLRLIFEMLGTPTPESWEGFQDLKLLRTGEVTIGKERRPKLRDKYQSKISPPALNLIEKLLELDPKKRLTANRALNSRYFMSEPRAPENPEDLGKLEIEGGHFHEFQTKKKRKEAKAIAEKTRQNALEMGRSEKEAQEEFDGMYRGIMEKVAREGLGAVSNLDKKQDKSKKTVSSEGDKSRPERRRSSSEREKDREPRRDRKSRDERRVERKREGRDKEGRKRDSDKDKDKSRRRRSDSEEQRRKRRREERESKRDEEKKRESDTHETAETSMQVEVTKETDPAEKPVASENGTPKEAIDSVNANLGAGGTSLEEAKKESRRSGSRERRRSKDRERRRSRDRDRNRDRHERPRERRRDRGDPTYDREREMHRTYGDDRERDWGRRERAGREYDPHDDHGQRGMPYGPRDGWRNGQGEGNYSGNPGRPPPGQYNDDRRWERDRRERSPPRGRGHGR